MNDAKENDSRCCTEVCICVAYFPPLPASGYTDEEIDRVRQLMTIQRNTLAAGADRAIEISKENCSDGSEDDEFVQNFVKNSRYLATKIDECLRIENGDQFAVALKTVRADVVLHADVLPFMQSLTEVAFSKRALYPALKKIHEALVEWLNKNASTLNPAEIERCQTQIRALRETCEIFEENESGEEKTNSWNEMMRRTGAKLDHMRQQGHLPEEFVRSLLPGWSMDTTTGLPMPASGFSDNARSQSDDSPYSVANVLAGLSYLTN